MSNMNKKAVNEKARSKNVLLIVLVVIAAAIALMVYILTTPSADKTSTGNGDPTLNRHIETALNDKGELVIPLSGITDKATFYSVTVSDVPLEVLAVKAPDGSIRTAFNTCQVCFASGKGYYVQEGKELVCQNCGNRFAMKDVEVTRGGCNPLPITDEGKVTDSTNVTISSEYLDQATEVFANWKNA